jgi:hypothetical protein
MHQHAPCIDVDDPVVRDAMSRIQVALDALVIAESAVGYLDEQQDVPGLGNLTPVKSVRGRSSMRSGCGSE